MYYINIKNENTDIHKRLIDYFSDKAFSYTYDQNKKIFELIITDITLNEINEIEDIFQQYDISIDFYE